MRILTNLLLCTLFAIGACTEPECPPGEERRGDVCFASDGGEPLPGDGEAPEAQQPDAEADTAAAAVCQPDAAETCNGLDDDCDGTIDESALVFADYDGDGVGAGAPLLGCPGSKVAAVQGDCDDANPKVKPGVVESCNGADDDCDGEIDEGATAMVFQDSDGDGHGNPKMPKVLCLNASAAGFALSADDCDDTCRTCSPDNAIELSCDGKDDDCDGELDDGLTRPLLLDCDGDYYVGSSPRRLMGCLSAPLPSGCGSGRWLLEGTESTSLDCNDANRSISPGAPEQCNDGLDTDCDLDSSATEANCT